MKNKFIACASLIVGLTLTLGSLVAPAGAAQNGSVAVTANVGQAGVLELSTSTVAFGSITPSDSTIEAPGQPSTPAVTATVKTNNTNWSLTQGITDFATDTNGNKITLNYKTTGGYAAMTASDALVSKGSATAGTPTAISYGLQVPWTLQQGSYNAAVAYTLALN